jgi:hypothetical protein
MASEGGSAAMGCTGDEVGAGAGSDKAAGDGDAGVTEVSNMGLGSRDDMEMGSAGTSSKGDGAGVGRVVVYSAGSGIARTFSERGRSSLSLLIHGWNGTCNHMVACWHFWMLWPGCEQKRHWLECNWEWGSGFCMGR